MSRHNRERRKAKRGERPSAVCPGCGAEVWLPRPEEVAAAVKAVEDAGQKFRGHKFNCGVCRAWGRLDESGRLVPLTPAEVFATHFESPRAAAAAESIRYDGPSPPGSTAFVEGGGVLHFEG